MTDDRNKNHNNLARGGGGGRLCLHEDMGQIKKKHIEK